jgi:hypothetical protein
MRPEWPGIVEDHPVLSRRAWLAGVSATWAWGTALNAADEPVPSSDELEEKEIREVTERAEKAGLRPIRSMRSRNYLAIGNAPTLFMKLTLQDCELLALDYLDYYQEKGFEPTRPKGRLTTVVLADDRAFGSYLHKVLGPTTGGVYQKDTNRLIVYDYRPVGPQAPIRPGHAALKSLAHEATHQLTFNTGLLSRESDTPLCVIEGIALYSEPRSFTGRTEPGQLNTIRLDDLAKLQRRGSAWISLTDLVSDDTILQGKSGNERRLLAYAQSWLLIYTLMKDPARLPGLRAYLKAIKSRKNADARLDDARAHWGDLDKLDQDIHQSAIRMLRAR